jgi:hypothetical protein
MMLRVVLVGVVAALGASIPTQPGCEHWYDSAQAWTTSLLAEWDTWTVTDEAEPRLPRTPNHLACEECRLARMRLVAQANESLKKKAVAAQGKAATKGAQQQPSLTDTNAALLGSAAVAFKPFAPNRTDGAFGPIIAIAFSQMPEGRGGIASISRRTEPMSGGPDLSEPADAAEMEIWAELCRLANEPTVIAAETGAVLAETSDLPLTEQSFICGFGAFEPEDSCVAMCSPNPAQEGPSEIATAFDQDASEDAVISCLDEAMGWDEEVEVVANLPHVDPFLADLPADVFVPERVTHPDSAPEAPSIRSKEAVLALAVAAPAPPVTAPCLADLPSDVFVPVTPSRDQEPVATNRPLTGVEPQAPRLGDAVELTRRAVSAWVSVLIGPALVQGSRR